MPVRLCVGSMHSSECTFARRVRKLVEFLTGHLEQRKPGEDIAQNVSCHKAAEVVTTLDGDLHSRGKRHGFASHQLKL
jgi:hypothetical protein